MKYGPLTKVLMNDLTTKYMCMLEIGDVIFPEITINSIEVSYESAIRLKYTGELFILDKKFTLINDAILLKNLEYDIIKKHVMYDTNTVITISNNTDLITFS